MRIRCPHCQQHLNIVDAHLAESDSSTCPNCGSQFDLTSDASTALAPAIEQIGQFQILEKLGQGQFGTVWKARDSVLERIVAIKLPRAARNDDQETAVFREARAAAALDHPNIVHLYEVGETSAGQLYIVSEFINGITLSDRIDQGAFPPVEVAQFIEPVARAIHHAHEQGVIHRDLKPSNILIDQDGRPHVTDFGLAKRDSGEITLTVTGMILGTPAYMSPEQARGDAHHADSRSDVYSLGAIMYELLTGQRPFSGSTRLLLHQIQSDDPRQPRKIRHQIPRDLETICMRALRKQPEDRYQSAAQLAEDVKRFLDGDPIEARPIPLVERWFRRIQKQPLAAAFLLLCCITAGALAAFAIERSKPDPDPKIVEVPLPPEVLDDRLNVTINSDPPGARVYLYPLTGDGGTPNDEDVIIAEDTTPLTLRAGPGDYLVVAVIDDDHFHEVYRRVPENPRSMPQAYRHLYWKRTGDQSINWEDIEIPSHTEVITDMVPIEGKDDLTIGDNQSPLLSEHQRSVATFLLDRTEVTVAKFTQANFDRLPAAGRNSNPNPTWPVVNVLYDEAVSWAERTGKRLPTEFEYELAATGGGKFAYPWGSEPPTEWDWTLHDVLNSPYDRGVIHNELRGLLSNGAEWTSSPHSLYPNPRIPAGTELLMSSGEFVVRGGPTSPRQTTEESSILAEFARVGARYRIGVNRRSPPSLVSFRCARSTSPTIPTRLSSESQ